MNAQSQSAPAPGRPVGALGARARRQKRRRELIAAFSSALGGDAALTEGQRAAVKTAAELTALAEDLRALAMSEGPGSPGAISAMVRLESTASRAVRALRLPEPNAAPPTLSQYLAEHEAEQP